jgi:hypothetical protein
VIPTTVPKCAKRVLNPLEDRRKNPERYSRLGVPNGMHRAEADTAWQAAAALADNAMAGLEAQGLVPVDALPNSEEALAKAALHEEALLALGPTNKRTKTQALSVLLAFTTVGRGRVSMPLLASPPSRNGWRRLPLPQKQSALGDTQGRP